MHGWPVRLACLASTHQRFLSKEPGHVEKPLLYQAQTPQPLGETERHSPHRRQHGQNQATREELSSIRKVVIAGGIPTSPNSVLNDCRRNCLPPAIPFSPLSSLARASRRRRHRRKRNSPVGLVFGQTSAGSPASKAVKEKAMKNQVELSAAIQRVMRDQNLSREELGRKLGVSAVMLNKIICGDVVPSRHLEKQMIEVLGIEPELVERLSARQQKKAGAAMKRESTERKAA
jgi:ribosome-binding protein aMBF1 (putative translation factor)